MQLTEYLARARRDMETARALCQICQRSGGAFLIAENCKVTWLRPVAWFRLRLGNHPVKNRAHTSHLFLQCRGESLTGRKTETKCEPAQSFRFPWNAVSLPLSLDLQTMLNTPEKPICFVERQHVILRE